MARYVLPWWSLAYLVVYDGGMLSETETSCNGIFQESVNASYFECAD